MELSDLQDMKSRSAIGETLAKLIKIVHDQVKDHLEKSLTKYKDKAYLKKKEIHFKVGDLVMAFLNNDRLTKGPSRKLQMKKIGPCKFYINMGTMLMN